MFPEPRLFFCLALSSVNTHVWKAYWHIFVHFGGGNSTPFTQALSIHSPPPTHLCLDSKITYVNATWKSLFYINWKYSWIQHFKIFHRHRLCSLRSENMHWYELCSNWNWLISSVLVFFTFEGRKVAWIQNLWHKGIFFSFIC